MSQLSLGIWKVSNEEIITVIHEASEVGYRSINTAAAYKNEGGVGKAIRDTGVLRDGLFIITRLWNGNQKCPRGALFENMEKLRLSYLNPYLVHWSASAIGHCVEA